MRVAIITESFPPEELIGHYVAVLEATRPRPATVPI